ncbi:aldo/keto reductase [Acrocarpospora macrocephala]|uniref:D-threo-aldose 1-dehydrogenase n=1 Tax=Acrocarpospora macrocephala TaxID=150177 RepID=A0A5M3WLE9_9ACTN|nr:aldo/keto reductase [Acrocarpospora macrocephala]GES09476.1 D-threo-aldose 1-dehydrogenase [Acrocarpospora macrocephala]
MNASSDAPTLRPLWAGGPSVTFLGYGAMELRGGADVHRRPRPLAREIAHEVLNTVLDEGITFIDTSIDYGLSEEIIGAAISGRRDEFLLATKAGCPLEHQPTAPPGILPHDFSPEHIRRGVEQSLTRLRTDHLDLLQLHASPAPDILESQGTLDALIRLRDEGMVRAIGISSVLPHFPAHLTIKEFQAYQIPYSPFERELEPYLGVAGERSAGVIVRGGVAQGLSRPKPTAAGVDVDPSSVPLEDLLDGDTVPGFLLRLLLGNTHISSVIAGSASPDHIRSNARAVRRGPLPQDTQAEAWKRIAAAGFIAGK